jgi:(+)-abscisic acid 8'-hydroxylase
MDPEVRERVLQGNTNLLINTFQEMKLFALNVMSIFGEKEMRYIEELKQCYMSLEKGFHSMTVSQPGTLFHEAMKALKRLGAIVDHISQYQRGQP